MSFEHTPHPWITKRKVHGAPKLADGHHGINGRIAVALTDGVGTMWCAYLFGLLALVSLPDALKAGKPAIVSWIAQTFLQLVLLSVIMVGQRVAGEASDKRSEQTYQDAEAVLHEAAQIQAHLAEQDKALEDLIKASAPAPRNAKPKVT